LRLIRFAVCCEAHTRVHWKVDSGKMPKKEWDRTCWNGKRNWLFAEIFSLLGRAHSHASFDGVSFQKVPNAFRVRWLRVDLSWLFLGAKKESNWIKPREGDEKVSSWRNPTPMIDHCINENMSSKLIISCACWDSWPCLLFCGLWGHERECWIHSPLNLLLYRFCFGWRSLALSGRVWTTSGRLSFPCFLTSMMADRSQGYLWDFSFRGRLARWIPYLWLVFLFFPHYLW